jgi:cobalt/nickel transport protein
MIRAYRPWHKLLVTLTLSLAIVLAYSVGSMAHFQVVLPSDDFIEEGESNAIELQLIFTHPAEAHHTMNMDKPLKFGVYHKEKVQDLTDTLEGFEFHDAKAWKTEFVARGGGDFVFYLVPRPYYESMEDAYITQYTKVVVNNAGFPTDWDVELGLEAEIVPLCKPYGLWTGNVFQGLVKHNGKAVPFAEIEVERLNAGAFTDLVCVGQVYPSSAHVTQVIKADENGVFTYGIPKSGWWGFAALMEGESVNDKEHEVGAVVWVRAYDME